MTEASKPPAQGVHKEYKENAKNGCDLLFRVTIRGRDKLVDDIPLHMSIKIFKGRKEFRFEDLLQYVNKNGINTPESEGLTFKPIIFTSESTKLKYYMLVIEGLDPKYKALYDHFDDVGNVYKKFMTHVTIDKAIYDDLKANPLNPEEIQFGHLMLEEGANNAIHTFYKSELLDKSDYGPKNLNLYNHADNARRKESRTGEVASIGPNKAVRAAEPTLSDRAAHQARLDKQKSKKNPVKVFSKKERKKLGKKMGLLAASEGMMKGPIKNALAALRVAGAMAMPNSTKEAAPQVREPAGMASVASPYSSQRMLNTIAAVETENGKNLRHKPVGGMHGGESAFGKYGLMPATIRETIHMHRDLASKHGKAQNLRGDDMRRYMQDNPSLEDAVAQKHLQRLEHHFGQDPSKIGYAWLEGIRGGYKAQNNKQDISKHWHVRKINDAYSKGK